MKLANYIFIIFSLYLVLGCAKQIVVQEDSVVETSKSIGNITYEVFSGANINYVDFLVGEKYQSTQVSSGWKFPFNHGLVGDSVVLVVSSPYLQNIVIGNIYFKNKLIFTDTAVGDDLTLEVRGVLTN